MPIRLLKRDKIDILGRLPLFETCTQRELAQVAALMVETHRNQGNHLTYEGREGGIMFVIVDGQAEVTAGDRVIGRLGPGDVVGELSLIDGHVRSATVKAISDVHLLELSSVDFFKLVDKSPKFVRNLLRALSLKVRQMDTLAN